MYIVAPLRPEETPSEEIRTLDRFKDLPHADAMGGPRQRIAADGSPMGRDQAMPPQLLENLRKEARGKMPGFRNLLDKHHFPARLHRQHPQSVQSILALPTESH